MAERQGKVFALVEYCCVTNSGLQPWGLSNGMLSHGTLQGSRMVFMQVALEGDSAGFLPVYVIRKKIRGPYSKNKGILWYSSQLRAIFAESRGAVK